MIAYQLDINNFFLNEVQCTKDPKEKDRYAIPRGAVVIVPPKVNQNEIQFWNNISWEIKPDFSKNIYYSKIDKSEKRFERGEAFDINYTDLVPSPESYVVWQDDKWGIDPVKKSEYDKQQCKNTAKGKLAQSDWSTLPDVQAQLSNYQDFVNYRSQLRNLVINPIENPVFPSEPEARWK